jgi:hypothetical protein
MDPSTVQPVDHHRIIDLEAGHAALETENAQLRSQVSQQSSSPAQSVGFAETEKTSQQNRDSQISTTTVSSIDSQELQKHELPSKRGSRPYRYVRHTIFSLYRRLFSFVFIANLIIFIVLLATKLNSSALSLQNVVAAAAANFMVGILMRNPQVVNMLFRIFGLCPTSAPLRLRRILAKVYHYGGLHSGCNVAGTIWFILYTGLVTRAYAVNSPPEIRAQPAIVVITYCLIALLVSIVGFAHPSFRNRMHNHFEAIHRFAGWSACGLLWAFAIVFTNTFKGEKSLGLALVSSPTFWFLVILTFSIIYPWLYLQKVTVRPEYLSAHAIRLHFNYRKIGTCVGIAISESPLTEWHSFATIPSPDPNSNEWSLVVSNAGDWTKACIQKRPTSMWVRGIPTMGVLRIAPIFKRVVIVATGSGIGPCLSLLNAKPIDCRILWTGSNPEGTYGESLVKEVLHADQNAVIIDTKKQGRPDMVALAYNLFKESGAEAVFTISNPMLTRKIVYGLEARGVPSYGPIFDS